VYAARTAQHRYGVIAQEAVSAKSNWNAARQIVRQWRNSGRLGGAERTTRDPRPTFREQVDFLRVDDDDVVSDDAFIQHAELRQKADRSCAVAFVNNLKNG
jgi:hypothetical protein